jgi:hypothetical protein
MRFENLTFKNVVFYFYFFYIYIYIYFFSNKVTCATQYIAKKKRPEGLHEKEVQDPYNSKLERSDLKNSCLSRNSNLTGITFESLFTLTHTLKLKEGRSSI